MDIEKYFDTVNHDKLISTLRERVNNRDTLHLIRLFLKVGVNEKGVPQGSPMSPILLNIYLDKLDKEMETRGLHYARYADDVCLFVKSEMAANRVMKSITNWMEKKLFLKVNLTKKQSRKTDSKSISRLHLLERQAGWKCRPTKASKTKLYGKVKVVLKRKQAVSRPLAETFKKVNQIVRGWINYYRIGSMKTFIDKFGQWLRHKIRVIIIKQWKVPKRIGKNLQKLNRHLNGGFSEEDIFKVANSRLGWYRQSGMIVVNFLLNPTVLARKKKDRPGLVNPLTYYLRES